MSTLNRPSKITLSTIFAALLFGTAGSAMAKGTWAHNHPRRHEVNHRLSHQDQRIHQEVKEGEMSHAEASNLHAQDRAVRQDERAMAAQNGGHITKQEQHALNQQENGISRQIGQ